jgi:hypothetical protein
MSQVNSDGLLIKFGTEKGKSLIDAGEYNTLNGAGESVLELEVNLAELTTSEVILSDVNYLPKGAQINWVKTVAEVLGQTGTSIDVGLVYRHATTFATTELDYDGLLAAFPLSGNYDGTGDTVVFTENATIPASVTGTGALVGTILASTAYKYFVSASYAAGSAFTAGRLRITIGYTPSALADNGN